MTHKPKPVLEPSQTPNADPWDRTICLALLEQLWALRKALQESELRFAKNIHQIGGHQQSSARNLVHYLAFRATDLRALQNKLARLGVSSLGRAESHVMANLDKVLGILHRLTGQSWQDLSIDEPAGSVTGERLLRHHADALLGPALPSRRVRIMVTLGTEAATDFNLVRGLVKAGMDIARINCAHDDAPAWRSMAKLVRRAAKAAQREVKILMDLGGPKVRTGPMEPGPRVVKLRPRRDALGSVVLPSRLWIGRSGEVIASTTCDASIEVDADWLNRLRVDGSIDLTDARGKKRRLRVAECHAAGAVGECLQTYYLTPDVALVCKGSHGHKKFKAYPGGISALPGDLHLHGGDRLQLTIQGVGGYAGDDTDTPHSASPMAHIACTMPLVFTQVHAGERILFDDGRIGGVIRKVGKETIDIDIVQARESGEKLAADKGINFPDSQLDLPALTEKDLVDLQTVAEVADLVGLSFAQEPVEIHRLLTALHGLKRDDMGLILKIETLRGFDNLPALMLAAMAAPSAGVMIARGDLAVECGFERMAEIQEEILCCAEAAHMPVIWATQVLETLGKTGIPSRAEISDASMGERAECVMLNKGPYVSEAIRALDDILRRMAGHQAKKSPLLRALRAWDHEEVA
jgi:pyruvate kinase